MLLLATGLPQTLGHWYWRNLVKGSGIAPPPGCLERVACACYKSCCSRSEQICYKLTQHATPFVHLTMTCEDLHRFKLASLG